jgi:hypothetical protein
MIFRAPYLRYQFRGTDIVRPSCTWCLEYEGECGYHLLRCPGAPARVIALRDRALRLICRDACEDDSPAKLRTEANLKRLFRLYWTGTADWRHNRSDHGHQPSEEALTAALLYMRETINEYAAAEPLVWQLPRYIHPPAITEDEMATAAAAAQRAGRPPQQAQRDSLFSLPEPSDDEASGSSDDDSWQLSPDE